MSALNVKIGKCARGSVATPSKLTGYVIYRLGLALAIYIMRIFVSPYQLNYSSLLPVDVANTLLVNHVESVRVCQFVHTFLRPL